MELVRFSAGQSGGVENVSFRINTNLQSLTALLNLNETDSGLQRSIERLSSGMRINSAADDPAGLIISESMRSKIQGIGQAVRNSQDAINMSKTAEAAMNEIQTLLKNISALAVHAANSAVVDSASLEADQTQIRSTLQSIDRIASQTEFGSKKLLDGSAGVVANVTAPSDLSSMFIGSTFASATVQSGPVTLTSVTAGTAASIALAQTFASTTTAVGTAGSFVINGISFTTDGTDTLQSLASKINQQSGQTGVTAQIVASGGTYSIQLDQTTYGSQYGITFVDPSNVLNTTATASAVGTDAVFDVSVTTDQGVKTVPFTGGRGPQASGLQLSDTFGNRITLTPNGNTSLGVATQVGVLSSGSVRFQIGADADQAVQFSMPTVFANRLGTSVVPGKTLADIDVTTIQGAQDAMKIIADAVTQVAQLRGDLGSFQKNFLESNVRSLNVANENLTASESDIRDVDMAAEISDHTRLMILQQSGMAVLAQANQTPQNVLQLLK
ncbi:MAG: hypothetical protein HYR64_07830 [Fimbriimonas ginsengisoli]|uniref:Flagellin n=1 Tax=Fimbriimonas ginsengisoli TaxID=1005039 RepID=A0A931LVJ1_FIMGI|nr:hypothetical protein [Fimbriimonas ginsengisoli]